MTTATEYLRTHGDGEIRKRLDSGLTPLQVTPGDGCLAVGWSITDYIERTGRAPELRSTGKEPLMAMAGTPWRTPNNIAFVIVTGKAHGERIEISRDLLAPARLASTELGTMEGNDTRERYWYNNMVRNRPYIESGTCILPDRFKGRPVIIAGAGPSLERQVDVLNNCDVPVIMTNRAVKVLKPKQGFYMSIDFKGETEWYEDVDVENVEAIFDLMTAAKSVAQPWKERRWFRQTYSAGLANKTGAQWYPKLPLLDPGHCVAYAALGLALWWGADPIIFVGEDFSFGKNQTMHAGEGANSVISAHPMRKVRDINGEETITDALFFGACSHVLASVTLSSIYGGMWKEHVPRFINCTEGGIFTIPNIAPLVDTLETCKTDLSSIQGTDIPQYSYKASKTYHTDRRTGKKKPKLHAKMRARGGVATPGYALRALGPKARRRIVPKDSYWSNEYHGPEDAQELDTGMVAVIHPVTGREMLMTREDYAELKRQGKAPDVAG